MSTRILPILGIQLVFIYLFILFILLLSFINLLFLIKVFFTYYSTNLYVLFYRFFLIFVLFLFSPLLFSLLLLFYFIYFLSSFLIICCFFTFPLFKFFIIFSSNFMLLFLTFWLHIYIYVTFLIDACQVLSITCLVFYCVQFSSGQLYLFILPNPFQSRITHTPKYPLIHSPQLQKPQASWMRRVKQAKTGQGRLLLGIIILLNTARCGTLSGAVSDSYGGR